MGEREPPVDSDLVESEPLFSSGFGWRRAAYLGARFGPRWLLRLGPILFGLLFFVILGATRRRVFANQRRIHGRRPIWADVRGAAATFINFANCLTESLAAGRSEASAASVELVGEEHLRGALRGLRGVVVVTAHVGAWDSAAEILRRDTARAVTTVMAPEPERAAGALHDSIRGLRGVGVYHAGGDPLDSLPLLQSLRRGAVVAIQLDRCPSGARAMASSLFGQSVGVPVGPFVLAALAGVPVLPVFVARRGFFSYIAVVEEPISLPRKPAESELREAVQRATSAMEAFISRHPTQWFHFSDG